MFGQVAAPGVTMMTEVFARQLAQFSYAKLGLDRLKRAVNPALSSKLDAAEMPIVD